jgi:hypothetical protein
LPQNQYALDFAQPSDPVVVVVSAAAGRVSYLSSGSAAGDVDAGLGYGNHIKILHPGGYNTFYAHLDETVVRVGDRVESGQPIGTMGRTGRAGSRHLHFALHSSNTHAEGAGVNEEIQQVLATEFEPTLEFRPLLGTEFVGVPDEPWAGRIYGSENAPRRDPTLGAAPSELVEQLTERRDVVRRALDRRRRLDVVAQERHARGIDWASRELAKVLAEDNEHPVALYLRATSVESPRRAWAAARASLEAALAANSASWRHEAWLPARASYHLGQMCSHDGNPDAARKHFEFALRHSTSADLVLDSKRALASLGP